MQDTGVLSSLVLYPASIPNLNRARKETSMRPPMTAVFFYTVATGAMEELPESVRFQPQDHAIIEAHKDELLALTDTVVKNFYDDLFATPGTRQVFREGERAVREKTLADWYRRTIEGPINEDYWAWQAYVGLLHVKRRVTNVMMIGGVFNVLATVRSRLGDRVALMEAMQRLLGTVAAVIAYAYDLFRLMSVEKITGIGPELIERQVVLGVEEVLRELPR
jgi:hypothetical protein